MWSGLSAVAARHAWHLIAWWQSGILTETSPAAAMLADGREGMLFPTGQEARVLAK